MKILIIGSGGREHALAWKIAQSSKVTEIFCAPGNAGTAQIATNIDISANNIEGLKNFALKNKIDFTIVGPEVPLVLGITDEFKKSGLKIFGPSKSAAQLEGSKVFSKNLMKKYKIPTADFLAFTNPVEAKKFFNKIELPCVIKADGLAAGKGVIICKTKEEAEIVIENIMCKKEFGEAGKEILIEEFLTGEEASILCFTDGETIIPMASSQDHKRIFDNDEGLNTGGMGAYSPAPVVTDELLKQIDSKILKPTIHAMKTEGCKYSGILYVGVMVTKDGPKVLEYNCRFGDPEAQCIIPRMKNDLIDIIGKILDEDLASISLQWDPRPVVCVVLASGGYPSSYKKGLKINGLDKARELDDIIIFHAGTKLDDCDTKSCASYLTNGGRVLNVVGLGKDIKEAIDHTYKAVKLISFDKMHYRTDIGQKALKWIS